MRSPGETWYQGTADAIYQNINLVEQSDPHVVAIFGGDHIYRMNVMSMIEYHVQRSAEVTVAAIPVAEEARGRVRRHRGLRRRPHPRLSREESRRPDDARRFRARLRLHGQLHLLDPHAAPPAARRRRRPDSNHDFGRDILPKLAGKAEIYAYDFQTNRIPGEPPDAAPYWRDVGTIEAYYEANMDLRSVAPELNLYNREWPVRTHQLSRPARQIHFRRGEPPRAGHRQHCFRRLHPLRRHGAQLGARTRRAGPFRRAGGGLRDSRQLRYRPAREDPPRHAR